MLHFTIHTGRGKKEESFVRISAAYSLVVTSFYLFLWSETVVLSNPSYSFMKIIYQSFNCITHYISIACNWVVEPNGKFPTNHPIQNSQTTAQRRSNITGQHAMKEILSPYATTWKPSSYKKHLIPGINFRIFLFQE